MTDKKISRRDAMKILGAAIGVAALANLPSKWDKPELAQGVLPAHARQSAAVVPVAVVPVAAVVATSLICGGGSGYMGPDNRTETIADGIVYADVTPAVAGISVAYSYILTGNVTVPVLPVSGVWLTDASGRAGCPTFNVDVVTSGNVIFTLSSGGHSCTQLLGFV